MAATHEYPVNGDPLVRGDPFAIHVHIDTTDDISTWAWRAQVRSTADSALIFAFDVVPDPDDALGFWLVADAERAALLREGIGFDLEQVTPITRTWWICPCLHVSKDYSRDEPVVTPLVGVGA